MFAIRPHQGMHEVTPMTYRNKMRIARWLYRKGTATEAELNRRFGGKISGHIRENCEFFTVTYPHGLEPVLEMTDKNIDNYRKALGREIAERREWVEPIVSVLALLCSIAALVISLIK